MSWGWKITFLYSGFVILILSFVIASTRQDFHLVSEDYYAQEIAYQDRIDRLKAAQNLSDPMSIQLMAQEGVIEIDYPDGQTDLSGNVKLYRPSNAGMDRDFEAQPDENHRQQLPIEGLMPGLWKVQVSWEAEGVPYYKEQVVVF